MKTLINILVIVAVSMLFCVGCSKKDGGGSTAEDGHSHDGGTPHVHSEDDGHSHDSSPTEHDRDSGGNEAGEESGIELALNESYDNVRNGARLILAYNMQDNSFNGTVANTTDKTLERVRVEVHLSNGKELGPTVPGDLAPGEKRDVKLRATSMDFDGWTAHPEVGSDEHGGSEGSGEHGGGESDHEHNADGSHPGETSGEHGGESDHEHNTDGSHPGETSGEQDEHTHEPGAEDGHTH